MGGELEIYNNSRCVIRLEKGTRKVSNLRRTHVVNEELQVTLLDAVIDVVTVGAGAAGCKQGLE